MFKYMVCTWNTHLLNNEWAVCKTPFIMWKSPLLNLATMSYKNIIKTDDAALRCKPKIIHVYLNTMPTRI